MPEITVKFKSDDGGVEVDVETSVFSSGAFISLEADGRDGWVWLTEAETRIVRDALTAILGEAEPEPEPDYDSLVFVKREGNFLSTVRDAGGYIDYDHPENAPGDAPADRAGFRLVSGIDPDDFHPVPELGGWFSAAEVELVSVSEDPRAYPEVGDRVIRNAEPQEYHLYGGASHAVGAQAPKGTIGTIAHVHSDGDFSVNWDGQAGYSDPWEALISPSGVTVFEPYAEGARPALGERVVIIDGDDDSYPPGATGTATDYIRNRLTSVRLDEGRSTVMYDRRLARVIA